MKKVFVVAHSHWDHEWYFTMEDADILLVRNMDYLIETLESDPDFTSYHFDAQYAIVEKYLRIRPENRDRLEKLIREKRLFVGPWYTQADAMLGKTEALIRNLLYGVKLSKQAGHSMEIGYLPDIFGQHAYLPSIFQEFGIGDSIFQRGVYNEQVEKELNFIWEAPDKRQIRANNLFFGYGPGKFLRAEPEYLETRLRPILEKLAELNRSTDCLLLPSGGDQVLVRRHFPKTIERLNEMSTDFTFELSDYETFMKEAWADQPFQKVIQGELLACQKSRIHHTCRSERYDMKQLNARVEQKVISILEPLVEMAKQAGLDDPQNELDIIWKKIFDSQAHNGIGASNSDDANHDIVVRLTSAERMADDLINLYQKQLTASLDLENPLTVFNFDAHSFTGHVEATIFTAEECFQIHDANDVPCPFTVLKTERLPGGRAVEVTSKGEKEVTIPDYYRTEILLHVENVPATSWKAYQIASGNQNSELLTETDEQIIQNEHFRIQLMAGIWQVDHLKTGIQTTGLLYFDDTADAGDSFDYSPLEGDQPHYLEQAEWIKTERSSMSERLYVKHSAELPTDLSNRRTNKDRQPFAIYTVLELRRGEPFIRVHHEIDNHIKDHRLRALIPSGFRNVSTCYGDQGFSLLERSTTNPHLATWKQAGFVEAPQPIYPFERIIHLSEADRGFSILANGLKEYQVLPESGEIALTLFRSNGLLGRDDLAWRPGRASGINNKVVETPAGQMLQTMTFDYAIVPEENNPATLFGLADHFEGRQKTYQLQSLNSFHRRLDRFEIPLPQISPSREPLCEISNPAVRMSALKSAFDGNGMIARFYNPSDQPATFDLKVRSGFVAERVTLEELPFGEVPAEIPAKGYLTVKVTRKI
ncbi:glycoside hydrolase family 38 C-terminal domain-containing protein [Listeria costaricensis]|uniref:glycoside hydrolase family 38 N-terminal domain-containing protein n=1 Tax=Listeria costaricensis TaxID=2026604 RepID=UPI000C0898C5|nr:glycoside hydrolase family 38 C-terminal domain-containing protein [Listeria costaricensis]